MNVFVVVEEVQYAYSNGEYYKNIYGIYASRDLADKAVIECESQSGGSYYAWVEESEVIGA